MAAPSSGAGKTTVTLGLLAAFRARGVRVRAAKSGPDYIDPAFHAAATGRPSLNLDAWAMPPPLLDRLAVEAGDDADLLVVEAAMGLFDGAETPDGPRGAAAELAARYGWPVLLVLDVSAQAQTAAAVAHGLATYAPGVEVAAVVLNRVAGARHAALIAAALGRNGLRLAGAAPADPSVRLPERHLGLVQAGEHGDLDARLERLGGWCGAHLDLDLVLSLARPGRTPAPAETFALPPPAARIALARDAAFSFVYPHLLEDWRRQGAELEFFSPLADEPPPEGCGACWLPGGYPELHAGALAAAGSFKSGLARFAETRPVHGECGGHMVLGRALVDAGGTAHAMTGLLDHVTSFAERRLQLGYRQAVLLADGALGPRGARIRGHEHHHACTVDAGRDAPLADLSDAGGRSLGAAGGRRGHASGSFFHAVAAA